MNHPDGQRTTVEYRVTGGGSVVMETMFAGESHEMINMDTIDGDAVVAEHYCAAGNQPVLRLNTAKSSAKELVFDFVKVRAHRIEELERAIDAMEQELIPLTTFILSGGSLIASHLHVARTVCRRAERL